MGYALLICACFVCNGKFSCNPVKVPSFRNERGDKEPVCRGCMEVVNRKRVEKGLKAFVIPEDAYEACDEGELG